MRTAYLLAAASAPAASQATATGQQHSGWHSPVPYLFGGLAAMLGLIAFALLILACSYWKLSGYLEGSSDGSGGRGDLERGDGKPRDGSAAKVPPQPLEMGIVVIMAGDEKPTFLATPMSSRASSFGDNKDNNKDKWSDEKKGSMEAGECTISEATPESLQEQQDGTHESHQGHENQQQCPEAETYHTTTAN